METCAICAVSDCKAALESGQTTSGIYKVQPDHIDPFYVSKSI